MSKSTPTWPTAIREAIDSALIDVHTALPCSVKSYDAATQRVDVVPQIKRPLESYDTGDITHEELPVLPNIPVAFPRAGNMAITFPLEAGHFVLVVFSEYSIDQWLEKGRPTAPGDIGHLTLTGGVAIPIGPYPSAQALENAHAEDLVVGEDSGTQIHIKPSGACEVTSDGGDTADDFVAMADKTASYIKSAADAAAAAAFPNDGGKLAFQTFSAYFNGNSVMIASSNLKADE